MALTDKVERLEESVTVLKERNRFLEQAIAKLQADNLESSRRLVALEKALALQEQKAAMQFDSLQSWKAEQKKREEEWGRRAWSFGPNLVAAVLSVVLSVIAAWLTARRSS